MPIAESLRKPLFFAGLTLLLTLAGCGNNGPVVPHQTGSYTNASFKGSYVYEVHGFITTNGNPYREVGVLKADGNGNITAGTDTVMTVGLGSPAQTSSVSGQYTVAADGTGQIVLGSTALGSILGSSQVNFALTLASTSNAYFMEADPFANGTGLAQLQDSTAIAATPTGNFVFRIHQDLNSQSASESQVGLWSIASGSATGAVDENLISGASSLTITGGTFAAPGAFGVGAGSFSDSSSAITDFVYFVVDRSKLVLLVSSPAAVGSGDAEAQQSGVSSGLNGTYAFGSRGDDLNAGMAAFATVGQFTASGANISTGVLDSMQDTSYAFSQATFSAAASGASPNPSTQGRVQVSIGGGPTMVFWLVSPARAFFLMENESAVEDGTADLQTSTSFSPSTLKGQHALAMDGIDVNSIGGIDALARIGTIQFDGSNKLTLVELVNESGTGSGATAPGALAGKYQVGGSGRTTAQITSSQGGPNLVMYAVSGTKAYALQIDRGTNTSGVIQLQQ